MASPNFAQQTSTPANSKRKTSGIQPNSPPRRPMPVWDKKMDALGHCYEGELAEDQRRPLYKGAAETCLANDRNDAARHKRVSELKSKDGAHRDALMAHLILLRGAHQRLTGSSMDVSARYGEEKLAMGEILPIFDDLNKLWQSKTEEPVSKLERSNEILVQQDKLCEERDQSIELMKAAQQERDRSCEERDSYLKQMNAIQKERDELLQERDRCRKESELLTCERDELRIEKEQSHQRWMNEQAEAAKQYTGIEMVPRTLLRQAEKRRDELLGLNTRYQQERDDARQKSHSRRIERDEYQTRVEELKRDLEKAEGQASSFKDVGRSLVDVFSDERAARRKADRFDKELNTLQSTLDQERIAFEVQLGGLTTAHVATATERDDNHAQLRAVLASQRKQLHLKLRQQRSALQGAKNNEIQGLRRILKSEQDILVGDLTRGWEREKAGLVASRAEARKAVSDMAVTARREDESHSATLKTHLNSVKVSREAIVRNQETIHDLVITIAVSRSSYNGMHSAFMRRGRIISNDTVRIQGMEEQLTRLQEDCTTSTSESRSLREKLHNHEEEVTALSIANEDKRAQNQGMKEQLTRLQDDFTTSTSESSSFQKKLHTTEKDLAKLSTANEANFVQIQEMEEQLTRLQKDYTTSISESKSLREKLHNHEEEVTALSIANEDKRAQNQGMEEQLTRLQDDFTTSISESSSFQKKLHTTEKDLAKLSTANEANILALHNIQNVHAVCEQDQRLHLGRIDRHTFFEDFPKLAESLTENGRVFKGQESGQIVNVCFCVLSEKDEALCVIRRPGGSLIVWNSKLEDCSTFSHSWRRWLCLGGEDQSKPIYICVKDAGEPETWLRRALSVRTLSTGEVDRLS